MTINTLTYDLYFPKAKMHDKINSYDQKLKNIRENLVL